MAKMPWITPQEVRNFTSYEEVKNKSDVQLAIIIQRATNKIINYTHNSFEDSENKVEPLPEEIKNIAILLAEALTYNDYLTINGKKSETFDDYSYSADIKSISVEDILADIPERFVSSGNGNVSFRMFKL